MPGSCQVRRKLPAQPWTSTTGTGSGEATAAPYRPCHAGPVAADVLRVTRSLAIPLDELEWRFSASGGPGGQHANTANTRAEVRFDVARSPSLGPRQRARLLDRLG